MRVFVSATRPNDNVFLGAFSRSVSIYLAASAIFDEAFFTAELNG